MGIQNSNRFISMQHIYNSPSVILADCIWDYSTMWHFSVGSSDSINTTVIQFNVFTDCEWFPPVATVPLIITHSFCMLCCSCYSLTPSFTAVLFYAPPLTHSISYCLSNPTPEPLHLSLFCLPCSLDPLNFLLCCLPSPPSSLPVLFKPSPPPCHFSQ